MQFHFLIGYLINVSKTTYYKLEKNLEKQFKLNISENFSIFWGNNTLYGFLSKEEKDFFLEIKNVNKITAKGTFDILLRIGEKINEFKYFIINQDKQALNKIFGLLKKAESLIFDINLKNTKKEFISLIIENKKNDYKSIKNIRL